MKISSTTPILIILGLTLLLLIGLYGVMSMQGVHPPDLFSSSITLILGAMLAFWQHPNRPAQDTGTDKKEDGP